MPPTTQKLPNPPDVTSAPCQSEYDEDAQPGELSAANDPSLAIVRLMPKAKLSSFPRNHRAIAVVTPTISDSAPRPNTKRPATITESVEESMPRPNRLLSPRTPTPSGANTGASGQAVTTDPSVQIAPKSSVDFLVPIRSMMLSLIHI